MSKQTNNANGGQGSDVANNENKVNEVDSSLVLSGFQDVGDISDIEKKIESATVGGSVVPRYMALEVGESVRGVFLGIQPSKFVNDEGNQDEGEVAGFWVDRTIRVNRGAQLISALKASNLPARTPVEVACIEERKARGKGTIKIYDVRVLNLTSGE